ncbi:MAG: dihydrolipoamide acetyltransferase family protein [Pseudomonadota bacterium]
MATHEFLLPDVGEGLESATVLKWLASEGDTVVMDQIIVELETDKAVVEIPAPVAGTLTKQGGEPGASLAVGAVLAVFEADQASNVPAATPVGATSPVESSDVDIPVPTQARPGTAPKRILASPATRKFARNNRVDLALVSGSGSRGQITQSDVEAYLSEAEVDSPPAAAAPERAVRSALDAPASSEATPTLTGTHPLSGLRKQIATNMQTAWREIPHIFTFEEVDATALAAARREINETLQQQGQRLSFLPFFVKACVIALQQHPRFNASLNMHDETVTYHAHCNIGIATATPEGLIVTVVRNAEQKSLLEIGQEIETLAALARERRVSVDQIKGGTFTVSNFGSYGGTLGTPIIRPPEVAIAGFGHIHDKVVAENGHPVVRPILPLAMSTDHRLNDGEHLGAFVSTLSRLLHNPVRMLCHL